MRSAHAITVSAAFALVTGRAEADPRVLYVINHATAWVTKMDLTYHAPDKAALSYNVKLSLAPGAIVKIVIPDTLHKARNTAYDVSNTCEFDASVTFANGAIRSRTGDNVCLEPGLEVKDDILRSTDIPSSEIPPRITKPTPSDKADSRGEELLAGGRFAEALPYLQEAVRLDPRNDAAEYELGLTYYSQNRLSPALAVLDKGLRIASNPFATLLHELRGHVEWAMRLNDLADDDYMTAAHLYPGNRAHYLALAVMAARDGTNPSRADDILHDCAPSCSGMPFEVQVVRSVQGLVAPQDLIAAAKTPYDLSTAHMTWGFDLLRRGKIREAREQFNWVVQNGPVVDIWRPIARAHLGGMR